MISPTNTHDFACDPLDFPLNYPMSMTFSEASCVDAGPVTLSKVSAFFAESASFLCLGKLRILWAPHISPLTDGN